MPSNCKILAGVLDAQARMFRLAERDHSLSRKVLSLESGISYSTLKSWASGTEMPVSALAKLAAVIPNELTSLLLGQIGKHIADDDADEGSIDELAGETSRFVAAYVEARADGVVSPIERRGLQDRARRIASIAERAKA